MYLVRLNEMQKKLFLDLAHYLALVDGNYSDEEKEMVQSYCHEMQISPDFERENTSIEDILKEIKEKCSKSEMKIMIFEAIGLAMADDNYDDSERKFIHSLILDFELEEAYGEKCEKVIKDYFRIQSEMNSIVTG